VSKIGIPKTDSPAFLGLTPATKQFLPFAYSWHFSVWNCPVFPVTHIDALAHDLALVLSPLGDLCVGSPKASKLVDYPVDLEEAVIIIEQLKEEHEKLKQENESYKVNQEQVQNQYMKLMCINNRLHSMIEQTKDETEKLKRENEALYKSSI
jgi:hypothetical protein